MDDLKPYEEIPELLKRVHEVRRTFIETGKCGHCGSDDILLTGRPCYYAQCKTCYKITGDDPAMNIKMQSALLSPKEDNNAL